MSRISRQDLKTILLCGIHLAKLDDNFHFEEKKFLRRFAEGMNLAEGEREELLSMGGSLAENLGLLTSDYARELLMKTLCAVSFVDGNTSKEEQEFIERVRVSAHQDFKLAPTEDWGTFEDEVFVVLDQGD